MWLDIDLSLGLTLATVVGFPVVRDSDLGVVRRAILSIPDLVLPVLVIAIVLSSVIPACVEVIISCIILIGDCSNNRYITIFSTCI